MLEVVVYVNGKCVAHATARNISELDDYSDYEIHARQYAHDGLGIEDKMLKGRINSHYRRQSAWALVSKISDLMMKMIREGKESSK